LKSVCVHFTQGCKDDEKKIPQEREREWISSLWDLCLVESQIRKKKNETSGQFSHEKKEESQRYVLLKTK
jgi:hypothetical protein